MKKITEILFPLALVAAAACSEKVMPDVVDGQGTDGAGVSFRVSARAWETEGKELVRLYIAERLPEHNHQGEDLHCDTFMDLEWTDGAGTDGSSLSDQGYVYTLEGMLAQWYKFAFVAVPDGIGWTVTVGEESYTEVLDGKSMLQDGFSEGLCDFNGIYIDYTRVMEAQEDDVDLIRRGDVAAEEGFVQGPFDGYSVRREAEKGFRMRFVAEARGDVRQQPGVTGEIERILPQVVTEPLPGERPCGQLPDKRVSEDFPEDGFCGLPCRIAPFFQDFHALCPFVRLQAVTAT